MAKTAPAKSLADSMKRLAACAVAGAAFIASGTALAATYYWDSNGEDAGFGTVAGTWAAPTIGNAAQGWSADATGATLPTNLTTTISDALNFGTATVALTGGTINVSGTVAANALTFGSASGAITLSGGTITLGSGGITVNKAGQVIGSQITLNASRTITAGTSGANLLALNGAIQGGGGLTFTTASVNLGGAGTVIKLGAANTYSGNTTITVPNTTAGHNNSLTVQAAAANALPTNTVLTLDGYAGTGSGRTVAFDLSGRSQAIAGLTNVPRTDRNQRIINGGAAATLAINTSSGHTFSGQILNDISLLKRGAGALTLAGGNTYTGTTRVEDGTLMLGRSSAISAASNVTLSGGTLEMGSFTNALGTLTLAGPATLALGEGALSFKASQALLWTGGLTLAGALGETTLRFGTNSTALTAEQLRRIRFKNMSAHLNADGYLWIPRAGSVIRIE